MKKYLFILFACLAGMQTISAQSFYDSDTDIYGLGTTSYLKKWHRDLSLGIGNQFELGLSFRRDFGNYFAWDVFGISYAYDYSDDFQYDDNTKYDVTHEFKLRTGFRGFTPKLGKKRIYAGLGFALESMSYTEKGSHSYWTGYGYSSWYSEEETGLFDEVMLGIDVQFGLCLSDKFSIGYKCEIHKFYCEHNDHMLQMTYSF